MTKDKLLQLINKEWSMLLSSIEGMDDNLLQRPGVVGDWSLRDILVHITTWEEEALKALPLIIKRASVTRYTKYGGIDGFNAREQDKKSNYSLKKTKEALYQIHQTLVDYIKSVHEDIFIENKRFAKRIYWDAYGHYREHRKQILDWRQKQGF